VTTTEVNVDTKRIAQLRDAWERAETPEEANAIAAEAVTRNAESALPDGWRVATRPRRIVFDKAGLPDGWRSAAPEPTQRAAGDLDGWAKR
jgi:hypothetical protein